MIINHVTGAGKARLIHAAPVTLALLWPLAVRAEAPPAAQSEASDQGAEANAIIVTGTRGQKRSSESLAPIQVVGKDSLINTGRANLRDALQDLVPSFTNSAGYPGQLGFATKTATLRGLGANETLVLVNGKRRHTMGSIFFGGGSAGQSPTDVDLIPTADIDHVEILSDGAAAQYGSDAIAGVINIILKNNRTGGSGDVTYGQYTATTGPLGHFGRSVVAHLNQGFAIGRDGYLSIGGDFQRSDYTNNAGYVPLSTSIYAKVNGQPDVRESTVSRYRQISGIPKISKETVGYNFDLPLSDAFSFYSFSTYAHRYSQAFGWFRTAASQQNIPELNPDGYLPRFITTDNDYQTVSGLKGELFATWHWDLSSSYAEQRSKIYNENTLNPSYGTASPRNFYNGSLTTREWTNNFDIRNQLAHGLFAQPATIAAGFEYRRDGYAQGAGDTLSWSNGGYTFTSGPLAGKQPNPGASGLGGYSPSDASNTWRSNIAVYGDFDQHLTRKWEAEIAARYEHFSDFGSAFSAKASTRYEISKGFALRGTVSNGFHAPTLPQQYYTAKTTSYSPNPDTGIVQLNTTNYARVTDPMAVALGATALKPEKSRNYTLGFVASPTRNLDFTIDLYQIDLSNQILPITFTGSAVNRILENAGLLNSSSGIFYNVVYESNIAKTRTRGVDFTAKWTTDFNRFGKIRWNLLINQSAHTIVSVNPVPAALQGTGVNPLPRSSAGLITNAYPKNTIKLVAAWTRGPFDITLRGTRYSSTDALDNTYPARDQHVAPAFLLDIDAGWQLNPNAKLSIGGQNITDKRPNQLSATAQAYFSIPQVAPNYSSAAIYSADGAYVYARLNFTW